MSSTISNATCNRYMIMDLDSNYNDEIQKHLNNLPKEDKQNRFLRKVDNEDIKSYVNGINYTRDKVIGLFKNESGVQKLIGVGHLVFYKHPKEFSVVPDISISVHSEHKSKKNRLIMDRAVFHAKNQGFTHLKMSWAEHDSSGNRLADRYHFTSSHAGNGTLEGYSRISK